jgi:hypothetical protein
LFSLWLTRGEYAPAAGPARSVPGTGRLAVGSGSGCRERCLSALACLNHHAIASPIS